MIELQIDTEPIQVITKEKPSQGLTKNSKNTQSKDIIKPKPSPAVEKAPVKKAEVKKVESRYKQIPQIPVTPKK